MRRVARALLSICALAFSIRGVAAPLPNEIQIPGQRVFPESITSTSDGRLIIGSIAEQSIYVVDPGADKARPWIKVRVSSNLGVFGVYADDRTQTLWACWSEAPGLTKRKLPSALIGYDLKSGAEKAHYQLPAPGATCNDIATTADGSVYVTDSTNMEIDWLSPGATALRLWAGHGAFGPAGGILDGISAVGDAIYVNALATNKLFVVPIQSSGTAGTSQEVSLDRAINMPDGMRSYGKSGVLVVEGGEHGRLSLITVHGAAGEVTTIKEGYVGGPVSVAVLGQTAYVLEGQLYGLFDPKHKHAPLTPFKASAVALGR
jgi:sugar lactone lactonase YvrE